MIRIVVYGEPAPQGSKRHVGNGRMIESSKKVKPWREDVRAECALAVITDAGDPLRFDGPIRVRLTFTLRKPSSAPKTRITWPCKKPDIDKLARSTLDAMTSSGLIADDARVVELFAAKRFPNEGQDALDRPGCVIEIEPIP